MLANIYIRNFRSIKEIVFPIKNGLNVIVGSNGSGKTNILHALKFLSNIVTSGASLAMAKAGGPSRNFRRGENSIEFSVHYVLDHSLFKGKQATFFLFWDVVVSQSEEGGFVHVRKEVVRIVALSSEGKEDVLKAEVTRTSAGAVRPRFEIVSEDLITKRLFESSYWVGSSFKKSEVVSTVSEKFQEVLQEAKKGAQDASFIAQASFCHANFRRFFRDISSLDEYNISPDVARQAVDPLPVVRMGPDGGGVSEVVGALENRQFSRIRRGGAPYPGTTYYYAHHWSEYSSPLGQKNNPLPVILEHVQAAIPSIDSIGTQIDPSSGRRFVVFGCGGSLFRPQEMSDGTFKWLCLLVALLVPTTRVVLLEEPENFMHPWMQQRFISLARQQASSDNTSVVLSTHSVTVLNSLVVDELRVVHQVDGETVMNSVENKEEIERILSESTFGLGDIWISGEFGGVTGGF